MARTILQKLLSADWSKTVLAISYNQVGGLVVEAGYVVDLSTPAALLEAYGVDDRPDWVDVIRFEQPVCSQLRAPDPTPDRPWPTYPSGFLRPVGGNLVPVWDLSWTRLSPGAELWRIHSDGKQECLSQYRGAAQGWAGARGWQRPVQMIGPRATWQGTEYPADVAGNHVQLLTFEDPKSPDWVQSWPLAWARVVNLAECEVFELVGTSTVLGIPVRVLSVTKEGARVQLLNPDPDQARTLHAVMIDPGIFEASGIPVDQLLDTKVVANQLVQTS